MKNRLMEAQCRARLATEVLPALPDSGDEKGLIFLKLNILAQGNFSSRMIYPSGFVNCFSRHLQNVRMACAIS